MTRCPCIQANTNRTLPGDRPKTAAPLFPDDHNKCVTQLHSVQYPPRLAVTDPREKISGAQLLALPSTAIPLSP